MDPILTIILLTYNHEKTVSRAIKSILSQKTKFPYQILICEDKSSDKTLEICEKYTKKHPSKIKLVAQRKNTKGKHLRDALISIKSKYFTILEGDDYWCNNNKIDIAVNTLENKLEYTIFASDTLYKNSVEKSKKSLVNIIHNIHIKNPIFFENAPYLHTSSRIYRNIINFHNFPKNLVIYDIYLLYLFLDKGPMFYYDKIMSVYNINENGLWSGMEISKKVKELDLLYFRTNILLNYKYDIFFSTKVFEQEKLLGLKNIFGKKIGWVIYIYLVKKNFFLKK